MVDDMTDIHYVTAEASSVNDIMQAALACERSFNAKKYYQLLKEENKRARKRRSRSRSRERKKNKERERRRSPSPKRLQKVDGHRYQVKGHNPKDTGRANGYQRFPRRDSERKPFNRDGNFSRDKKYESPKPKMFNMVDTKGKPLLNSKGKACLFHMTEVSEDEGRDSGAEDQNSSSDNEQMAAINSESDAECTDNELDPWGGSQYSSDAGERLGYMNEGSSSYEWFASMRDESESDYEHESEANDGLTDDEAYEEIYRLNFTEYLRTMKVEEHGIHATLNAEKVRIPNTGKRPKRTAEDNRCLSALIEVNGLRAFALFDSGSTSDAISPDFARQSKIRVFLLENPVTLQLGTKGSRSKINHGCITSYKLSTSERTIELKMYFDIANVDRYNAVIGTVFMRRHGISLHFEDNSIRVRGKVIPSLSEGEEVRELARRYSKRVSTKYEIPDKKEIDVKARPVAYGISNNLLKRNGK
ncbi:hypothetical protein PM082_014249 [Marasmius tenuissimus]|nr:hypothetical protein PM082_014249 [Marasmius tenuissimus]